MASAEEEPLHSSSHSSARSGSGAAQGTSENRAVSTTFRDFQKLHDKTYTVVQKGLNADEEGDVAAAQLYYTSCLPLLEQVLSTDCESWLDASTAEKETAQQLQLKMSKTKLQVTFRLESLQGRDQTSALPETSTGMEAGGGVRLPSYEEAMSSGPSSPVSETGDGNTMATSSISHTPLAGERLSTQGTELFCIADGVQIFHITYEGYVTAPSYPTSLHIIRFEQLEESSEGGPESGEAQGVDHVFLQVGDWLYPLVPGASPILHTSFGAYLFPDLSPDGSGSSVGLILPETLSQEDHHILEDVLRNFAVIQDQQVQTPMEGQIVSSAPGLEAQGASEPVTEADIREEDLERHCIADHSAAARISRGILVASNWISWGVEKGAEKAGQWIYYGSSKLREKLQPEQVPRPVDCRIQKGAMYARKATNTAVSVSAFVVTKLGEATMALGRRVAPHIRKKGGELLPSSVKTEENKSRLHGVMDVASSGLRGFGTVWLSLERAAKALGRSVATETVATVQHKYGQEAGKLAENTVYAAGNVAMVAYNAESLAVKAIVKRTAKDAGSAVVYDLQEESETHAASGDRTGAGYDANGPDEDQGDEKKENKPPM